MKKSIRICLFVLVLSCCSFLAKAGFPVGKGHWLLSPTYNYYSASGYWNAQRTYTAYTNNGRFSSNYFGLYGKYGINRNWELVFNVPFAIQTYSETNYLSQTSSMGDATVGLSYYTNMNDYTKHFSITGSLILPLYQNINFAPTGSNVTTPIIGFQSVGGELKLGFAGNAQNTSRSVYYDLEAGVREYFSTLGPTQTFFNATLGVPLDDDWKLFGTLNGVSSNSTATTAIDNINRDFGYFRMTAGAGLRVSKTSQLYASVFQDVSGRNIGRGHGFSLFAVIKF
ncbi:MAG: hypothetical protein KGO81_03905 [Bacteroidota bacterium]|nr:hypothetical protein [Bacteroidota bacterium]